ncbi:MAG: ATP-dependent DNA helicase RecG [Acidobacteria bacterium]|nr:ATP-dependent DNA helicase RecG [Acidobacteriota bacterium]
MSARRPPATRRAPSAARPPASAGGSDLDRPLASAGIPGIAPATAAALARGLGLHTVRDLLEHTPRRYIDLSRTAPIGETGIGEEATVVGTVVRVRGRYVRSGRHLLMVRVSDGSGDLDGIWWNQPFRAKAFAEGATVAMAGKVERNRAERRSHSPCIQNPFVEVLRGPGTEAVHTSRIIPVHPATERVSANQIRRFVHEALRRYGVLVPEPVPPGLVGARGLMPRSEALAEIHFPSGDARRWAAHRRLVFEELLVLQTGLAIRKRRVERETAGFSHAGGGALVERFLSSLPFRATGAQRRTIEEIAADLAAPRPMNRLLQGEVGSGKTVVAVAAALRVAGSGAQVAFMAPTEVLAEQHYAVVRRLLEPVAGLAPAEEGRLFGDGFGVELLTGSVTGAGRERALEAAASGRASILIGTHALIQEGVEFARLGLALVDEQHRFGVHQRLALRAKGGQPDALIMTATPIPRTLALTLYGDLDVSVIDEMPPGRVPVETSVARTPADRAAAYDRIRAEVAAGHQAFVVCPLVSESESLEAKAAEREFARIGAEVFSGLRLGLLHGRMNSSKKEAVMRAMRDGEIDVLVATTVVEVGVDVPGASVMLVEDADRFGLSQLHQLRGRVGRGGQPAWCVLLTSLDPKGAGEDEEEREVARRRLDAMVRTSDGFELAEEDLAIRGEGQILGRGTIDQDGGAPLQTGRTDLRFARLLRDQKVLAEARSEAFALVDSDPHLELPEHRPLLAEVRRRFADRLDWLFAS